ncbi:MAG: transporter, partial [Pseudomonadota bacterium]|nr:transporter [Pseudomonadota bacterium]
RVDNLGDVKLLGNYQGLLPTHNLGLQLGVKLPTGQYGTKVDFYDGPNAGSPLDASLQAGTGSTDVIVGAYYYQAVSQNFDIFFNTQFQSAVAHKQNQPGNDFRPGNSATFSVGLRYEANPKWIPQVQLNLLYRRPDQGALADTADTVGMVAYISPGITAQVTRKLHAYGVLQVPVYSNLDGYQLFPHYTATAGLSYAF